MNQDEQHLHLLSIFHYVLAMMIAVFSCFPVFHLVFGVVLLAAPETFERSGAMDAGERQVTTLFALMFTIIPVIMILGGWTLAVCMALAGRFLAHHTHYTFCLVVAALACMIVPPGTALGVFTIIVLVRPSVKEIFDGGATPFGKPSLG